MMAAKSALQSQACRRFSKRCHLVSFPQCLQHWMRPWGVEASGVRVMERNDQITMAAGKARELQGSPGKEKAM